MSNFQRFLTALGQRESENQYNCVNSLGFTGRYQFGEAMLIELGYYEADSYYNGGGNGVDKNYWRGRWTSKAGQFGVNNYEDFRNNKGGIQEAVIKDEFRFSTNKIVELVGGRSEFDRYLQNSPYTYSGILAAAHLQGAWGAADLLKNGGRRCDEFGTCISEYARTFSNYDFDLNQFD